MSSILVEHAQYVDNAGKPLSGGKVYIGTNGADPVTTAAVTTIYSDRELTTPITNPQDLGSDGRTLNKIWVSGKYSIQVNDLSAVQFFQDLDTGSSSASVAVIFVANIVGGDTITGTTDASLTNYSSNQQFVFETVSANTGAVTLNVDGIGSRAIVKNNDKAVLPAELAASQVVLVAYNVTNDNFEWVNQNNKVTDFYKGTAVASAATTDIWATDGNTLHITGTTGITSFGTAPNEGARRTLVFDGIVTLTNSANLALPAGVDYTTAAGDVVEVYADTTTQLDVQVLRKNGEPVSQGFVSTIIDTDFNVGGTAPKFAVRAWVNFDGTGAIQASGNVASVTRHSIGDYTITFTTAMEDADYAIMGFCNNSVNTVPNGLVTSADTFVPVAGSCRLQTVVALSGALLDPDVVTVSFIR